MRFSTFLTLGVAASLLLSGCNDSRSGTMSADGRTITLEFWTLQLDTFANVLQPMFATYEKTHPHVHIHWVDVPFSEGSKRTLTALMSDHTPDVVNLNPDFSAVLATRKALVDMNEALPAQDQKTYLPVAWEAATLHGTPSANTIIPDHALVPPSPEGESHKQGMAFGLPWYITSAITLYNQELLSKAGIKSPPTGWKDVPVYVRQIRAKAGVYGMMPTLSDNGHFLKELDTLGVNLYDAQGRAVFATPQAISHLGDAVSLYRAGAFPAEAMTESHQAAVARYQAGTLGMMVIGPNFLKILQQNSPEIYEQTELAEQFPVESASPDFSLMVLTVPVKSVHRREAVEFARFITNAENQMALAKAAPVLPSVTTALRECLRQASQSHDKMERGRVLSAKQLLRAKSALGIRENQNTINQIMDYRVQMALLGKQSPANALKQAQDEINATLGYTR